MRAVTSLLVIAAQAMLLGIWGSLVVWQLLRQCCWVSAATWWSGSCSGNAVGYLGQLGGLVASVDGAGTLFTHCNTKEGNSRLA